MGQCDGGMYLVESVGRRRQARGRATRTSSPTSRRPRCRSTMPRAIVDALRRRFPAIVGPKKDDICYATQNRQDAVKFMAPQRRRRDRRRQPEQLELQPAARSRRASRHPCVHGRPRRSARPAVDRGQAPRRRHRRCIGAGSAGEGSHRAAQGARRAGSVRELDGAPKTSCFRLPKGLHAAAAVHVPRPRREADPGAGRLAALAPGQRPRAFASARNDVSSATNATAASAVAAHATGAWRPPSVIARTTPSAK